MSDLNDVDSAVSLKIEVYFKVRPGTAKINGFQSLQHNMFSFKEESSPDRKDHILSGARHAHFEVCSHRVTSYIQRVIG